MATRTISLITYATDGTVNTAVTPTVSVSYAGGTPSSLTPTANGSFWNVGIDDTQDATILISGTGLIADHLVYPRIPSDRVAPAATALSNATWTDTKAGYLDAAVSSRLATAGYTAPANSDIAAIKAKTDNLPSDPADQSLIEAAIGALNDFDPATQSVTVADKTGFSLVAAYDPAKAAASQTSVNAIPTTPLLAANYTAPDNAGISAIKAKTDNLPANPAAVSDVQVTVPAPTFSGTVEFAGTVEVPAPVFDGTVTIDPPVALKTDEREKLLGLNPLTAEQTTAAVEAATIEAETDLTPVLSAIGGLNDLSAGEVQTIADGVLDAIDDLPAEIDAQLTTTKGAGPWGASVIGWTEVTGETLGTDGETLMLDRPDVLVAAYDNGTLVAATRSYPGGDFSLFLPPNGTYRLIASAVGFAFPERSVTV